MYRKRWLLGIALVALTVTLPAHAGGPGPLSITAVHGRVQIRLLEPGAKHGIVRLAAVQWKDLSPGDHWQPVRPGYIAGTFLLQTGPRSWAHLEGGRWCVDPNSLVRIESYADYRITVLRGRISAADGKRGRSLFRSYSTG